MSQARGSCTKTLDTAALWPNPRGRIECVAWYHVARTHGARATNTEPRSSNTVLVVDDEAEERKALAQLVRSWGYEVESAASADEALSLIERHSPAVVVTDLMLEDMDGLALLQKARSAGYSGPVLLLTGHASIENAVDAMRQGAHDYLTKPVDPLRLQVLLEKAKEQALLSREVSLLRHQLRQKGAFGPLAGESRAMQEVFRWIELSASSSAAVFVHGESGTGKELVARTIHEHSARKAGPFVALNCAAIPESLIESELFGHEKGSFTGATERRAGCFELADGGTLFLDEIAEMVVSTQAKLLRVLQENAFRRVGGKAEITVDVRVIAATNRRPADAMAAGNLREDLYYRLNVFEVPLPPLRDRPEDIVALAHRFIDEFNRADNRHVTGLSPEAIAALQQYGWPGNVRELRNVIQRAVVLAGTGLVEWAHLSGSMAGRGAPAQRSLAEVEREWLARAMEEAAGDVRAAARLTGLAPDVLRDRVQHHGLLKTVDASPRRRKNR
jgi:DNA-binding NtrC family response regulator